MPGWVSFWALDFSSDNAITWQDATAQLMWQLVDIGFTPADALGLALGHPLEDLEE